MAEIKFSALTTEYLDRCIPDAATSARSVAAWEHTRDDNCYRLAVHDDARIKFRRLYLTNHD